MAGRIKRAFSSQTKAINTHIAKHQLKGAYNYFTIQDIRDVYDTFKGSCVYCGAELVSKTTVRKDMAHFSFRIPLKAGGSICKENMVLLCYKCKFLRVPKRPIARPVFGFDAFSDLIVQLVQSVQEKNKEKVQYFQVKVDQALADYIDTLFYSPLGTAKQLNLEDKRCIPVSDIVVGLSKELEKTMKLAMFQKRYQVEREIKENS